MPSSKKHKDDAHKDSRNKVFLGPRDTQEAFLEEKNGKFTLAEKNSKPHPDNAKENHESTVFLGPSEIRERFLKDMPSQLSYSETTKAMKPNKNYNLEESTVFLGPQSTQENALSNMTSAVKSLEKKQALAQNAADNASSTTVFLGPQSTKETSLNVLADNLKWTEKAKDEYLRRVKAKATQGVKTLLINAQKKADEIIANGHKEVESIQEDTKLLHAKADELAKESAKAHDEAKNTLVEAENIKDKAYEEGYTAGLHQAQLHLEEAKKEISKSVSAFLLSIHEQCITIFNSWREDLVSLLYEAVETSSGYLLDTEKKALLKNVLESSVNALLNKREYQVRSNPDDAPLIAEILEHMQNELRQNQNWTLVSDEQVQSGSVIVESPSGVIKNTTETREKLVRSILDQLTLPLSEADQTAYDAISQTLVEEAERVNIPLQAEEENAQENSEQTMQAEEEQANAGENAAKIPSEHENISKNTLPLDDSEVFSQENAIGEDIMQARETLIQQNLQADVANTVAEQPIEPQATQAAQAEKPQMSHEEKAEAIANDLVEKDLNFDSLNGFMENDIPNINTQASAESQTSQNSPKEPKQIRIKKPEKNKPEYTPELADELLNEMGF